MSELNKRAQHIHTLLSGGYYALLLIPLSLIYAVFSFSTVIYIHGGIEAFYKGMYPSYTIPFTLLTIIISLLMGITLTITIAKLRDVKLKSAGLGAGGIIIGSLAAGCPGCFFGLFPLFLSMFGITATLAILPFNGLELQALCIPLLVFSIWELGKETELTCKVKTTKAAKS